MVEGQVAVDHFAGDGLVVEQNRPALAPLGDAQLEGECGRVAAVGERHGLFKGIIGALGEDRSLAVGHLGSDGVGAVGHNGQAVVTSSHPHGLDKLRPAHMAVGEAAFKAAEGAKGNTVAVILVEIMGAVSQYHLILRLEIGMVAQIGGIGRREGVVGQALQVVADPALPQDAHGDGLGEDALGDAAQLRAAVGVVLPGGLVRIGQAVHAAMVNGIVLDASAHGGLIFIIAGDLIHHRRGLEPLGGVDHMFARRGILVDVRPLVGGLVELVGKLDEPGALAGIICVVQAVIEPEHHFNVVAAAGLIPVLV